MQDFNCLIQIPLIIVNLMYIYWPTIKASFQLLAPNLALVLNRRYHFTVYRSSYASSMSFCCQPFHDTRIKT